MLTDNFLGVAYQPGHMMCDTGRVNMSAETDNPAGRVRERMRAWMETTQVGQREFAGDLQKSQVWLQKVLTGENHVRLKDLDEVAHAMRTTSSELVRSKEDRYQLELTPTEVRILEKLRRRPEAFQAVAALLQINAISTAPTSTAEAKPSRKKRRV